MSQPGVTAGAILEYHAARVGGHGLYAPRNQPWDKLWPDLSGRGNHGELEGFAGTTASGWAGAGTLADPYRLAQTGDDEWVRPPFVDVVNSKVFTLEAWIVAPDEPPGPWDTDRYDFIVTEVGPGGGASTCEVGLCITTTDGSNSYAVGYYYDSEGHNGNVASDSDAFADGEIHHLTFTSDGTNSKLYVDGELEDTDTVPSGAMNASFTTIGAQNVPGGGSDFHNFTGSLMVVRMYPFDLDADEIGDNVAAGYLWTPETRPTTSATPPVRPHKAAA